MKGQLSAVFELVVGVFCIMVVTAFLVPQLALSISAAKNSGVSITDAVRPLETLPTLFIVIAAMVGISGILALVNFEPKKERVEKPKSISHLVGFDSKLSAKPSVLSGFGLPSISPSYK